MVDNEGVTKRCPDCGCGCGCEGGTSEAARRYDECIKMSACNDKLLSATSQFGIGTGGLFSRTIILA